MNILNFLSRLTGRPPLLPNGYPDMARNHRYIDGDDEIIQDVTRRINGGRQRAFHMIPPPPPMAMYPSHSEPPEPPMVAEIVNKISTEPVRNTPSTTSSLWCGTTVYESYSSLSQPKDPLVLDSKPLQHFLVKKYPWILDVTEVRIRPKSKITQHIPGSIYYGPLEIHITVSPTHHSELMNPDIEKKVREKLYVDLLSLITCMYENNHKDKPIIIFSPSHSETILEHVK
jgi:hypothetical protein